MHSPIDELQKLFSVPRRLHFRHLSFSLIIPRKMIIIISQYKTYFGSHDRKKSIHEISMKLWQTDFSQKNAKIFMNMSQIDKSSLWIERTCLKTCFKTLSFSRKNMRLKNVFEFFQFLWSPQSFCGVPNKRLK